MSDDLLERLLSLADRDSGFSAASLEEFSRGLRERARLVLDERVRPLEGRVAVLEQEVALRTDEVRVLASEKEALVRRVLGHLEQISGGLGWGGRRAKETLASLMIALRKELP